MRRDHACRAASILTGILFVFATMLSRPLQAAAQSDVINTSGDPAAPADSINTNGPVPERCGPPAPDPLWGAAEAWPESDRTWFTLAQDGYYARCVGSCGTAYCFRNPCYESDSAPGCLLAGTVPDPEIPVTMEDGSPVPMNAGNRTDNGSGVVNCFIPDDVAPQDRADWYRTHCLAQAPPASSGAPPAPIPAGIRYIEFEPGTTPEVTVKDDRGVPWKFVVEVSSEGGPPSEPGLDVDWRAWYDEWIKRLLVQVEIPRRKQFGFDPAQHRSVVDFEFFPDGNFRATVDNGRGNVHGSFVANRVNALRTSQKAPPFPKGSRMTSWKRTITFSHNMGGSDVLLGPPVERRQ